MKDLKDEIKDLSSRLYYCSDSKEGRKMRRYLEKKIRKLEKKLLEIQDLTYFTNAKGHRV